MKVLAVFGTRPEAIKMAPLVKAMEREDWIESEVCVTAQHREMLDQVLQFFDIRPDYDLDIMKEGQSLLGISSEILSRIEPVLRTSDPDMILVHGDTATTFATALAAYYRRIDLGHIEAGLRTGNLYSPWPEEANRKLTGMLAKLHFAPTQESRNNLLGEGVRPDNIHVTGNTVIDALMAVKRKIETDSDFSRSLGASFSYLRAGARLVLVTVHRRENFGPGLENICAAIRTLSAEYPDVDFIYPIHPNPNVCTLVRPSLHGLANVHLVGPQDYLPFVYLMMRSHIILTDSGGLQEEAPALGKPVLVTRDSTERPEAIRGGTAKLVGSSKESVTANLRRLLDNETAYQAMAQAHNPYGDGKACSRILRAIKNHYCQDAGSIAARRSGGAAKETGYTRPGLPIPVRGAAPVISALNPPQVPPAEEKPARELAR